MATGINDAMAAWLGTLPGLIRGCSLQAVLQAGQRASGMTSYDHVEWIAELRRCGYSPEHRGRGPNAFWCLALPGAGINREST